MRKTTIDCVVISIKIKVIISAILLLLCCCCGDNPDDGYIDAYSEFLKGNKTAKMTEKYDGVEETSHIKIWDCGYRDATFSDFQYALFDMNGEGVPELHVRNALLYDIFTYYNDELLWWHRTSLYRMPTDDGALLFTRRGAAPPNHEYIYEVLDFWGNVQLGVDYMKSDIDMNDVYDEHDNYYFCGVEVTKEQWDALTEPYPSAPSDNIEWIRLSEDFNRIQ